jgi:hypothetical protein
MRIFPRILLSSIALMLITCFITTAQQQPEKSVCDAERAVLLAEKQVEEAKAIEQPPKQIAVMIRAADVLWKAQPASARKIFADAFDLAEKHFKEKGDESKREGRSLTLFPDQRFVVMQAIAKRDGAWAKQLALRVAEETRKQAEAAAKDAKTATAETYRQSVQDKILSLAVSTAPVDSPTAIALIRNTFSYPVSSSLPFTLNMLRDVNEAATDQLYQDAVKNYAAGPINELFYLAAYPFLRDRIIGPEMYMSGFGKPKTETPNPALQQLFIETLLYRAEATLKLPEQPTSGANKLPEVSQLIVALTHLESIAAQYQPAYVNRIVEMKAFLNAALNTEMRQTLAGVTRQQDDVATRMGNNGDAFTKYSEQAEHESNPAKREMALAFAVLNAADSVSLDTLTRTARKVDDDNLRNQLLTFVYFKRAQKAIKEGDFFQAGQLAKNVEQLDLRAYLSYEAAAAALKKEEDKPRAKDILDEVLAIAYKAPNTNEKARTLLGVVYLYAKLEPIRAFEVMTEAVKTVNNLENPNFSTSFVQQKIEGKEFSSYYGYSVEGFDLEKVFRLLAPLDFEGALYRARSFDDRSHRALAILALASSCLEELEKTKKQQEEKKNPAEPTLSPKPEEVKKKVSDKPQVNN